LITFFASPKPFIGHIATIQDNAIASWRRLDPEAQIILFGDEEGVEAAATRHGAFSMPCVARNEFGTPLLSDMLVKAEQMSEHDVMCFINSDIILMEDFMRAARKVSEERRRYLLVGQCWNADIAAPVNFADVNWDSELRGTIRLAGVRRDAYSIDYFVFSRSLYGEIPDFAIGRGWFDHWLIWKPRRLGACVINATKSVCAVHQNHDYAHIHGGKPCAHRGKEADTNYALAGGRRNMCTIHHATHKLVNGKIKRDIVGSYFPKSARPTVEYVVNKLLALTRPVRHSLGIKRRRKTPV